MWTKSYWPFRYWTNSYWEGLLSTPETVSSTITFSQSISFHKVSLRTVTSTLTLSTHISSNEIILIVDPQVLALVQTYSVDKIRGRSVFDALTLNQNISVQKTLNISFQSNLVLTQSFPQSAIRPLSFTSYLNLVQSIAGGDHLKQTITQALHLTQDFSTNRQFTHHVQSILTFTQKISLLDQHVTSHLTLSQLIQQPNQKVNHNLVFTQTIFETHLSNIHVFDHLNLIQEIFTTAPHYLSLSDQLVFNEPYFNKLVPINNTYLQLPVVQYLLTPKRYCVRLRPYAPNAHPQEIMLSCPAFGDSEAGTSTINTKRTMRGGLFSYAKSSTNRKLKYSFLLDRNKSLELRNFINRHLSDLLILENWKGEQWLSYITSNPVSLIPKSRGIYFDNKGMSIERVQAEIEFTGSRIN